MTNCGDSLGPRRYFTAGSRFPPALPVQRLLQLNHAVLRNPLQIAALIQHITALDLTVLYAVLYVNTRI